MNITVPANDDRATEVLASGLPMHHSAGLAVDITLRSALTACGRAFFSAAEVDGAVSISAHRNKEEKHTSSGKMADATS